MKKEKIILMIKYILESIFGFYNKFLTNNEAFDEVVSDPRDYYLGNSGIQDQKPKKYKWKVARFTNQNLDGYKSSCTSQATNEAGNTQRRSKIDYNYTSGFVMWDLMKKLGLGKEGLGAYLIDAIKTAVKEGYIDGYYRVRSKEEIMSALYKGHTIVTGSNKINRRKIKNTNYVVTEVSSGEGHAFYIPGWDLNFTYKKFKGVYPCANSYGEEYGNKGFFYIPIELFDKIAFNSTYAIIVNPEWSKLSREELFEKYKLKRRKVVGKSIKLKD